MLIISCKEVKKGSFAIRSVLLVCFLLLNVNRYVFKTFEVTFIRLYFCLVADQQGSLVDKGLTTRK